MEFRRNVPQEEIDKYMDIAIAFIEDTKGWKREEYIISYSSALANVPLVTFQARRYDVIEEMQKLNALGRHPTGEIEVYVNTEEMRDFGDYKEALRLILETEKNKKDCSDENSCLCSQ